MPHYALPKQWQNVRSIRKKLPAELTPWILHFESLTQRLRQHCQKLVVRVVSQKWQPARYDESAILGLHVRESVFVREVELLCDDHVCITARSVFPKQTLQGKGQQLRALQSKPLIEVLATDPLLKRSDFEITQHPASTAILWERRSIFYFYGKPLLVSEAFLPAILDLKLLNM